MDKQQVLETTVPIVLQLSTVLVILCIVPIIIGLRNYMKDKR